MPPALPLPLKAELQVTVLLVRFTVPLKFSMPPPEPIKEAAASGVAADSAVGHCHQRRAGRPLSTGALLVDASAGLAGVVGR